MAVDCITVRQAAENWKVSPRYVQRLLADGRIPGAEKFGGSWMIPAHANKPSDPRKERKSHKKETVYLPYISFCFSVSIPGNNPDEVLQTAKNQGVKMQWEGEFAYLRGNFAQAKRLFEEVKADSPTGICAAMLSMMAAISSNDYRLFMRIELYLKKLLKSGGSTDVAVLAETALAAASVSMFVPNMVPEWLKNGDMSTVSEEMLPFVLYLQVKYLQNIEGYEQMFAVARTTLTLQKNKGYVLLDIYLRLMCAVACVGLEKTDLAREYLLDAMAIGMPHGFVTPFAENISALGILAEGCLKEKYPNDYKRIIELWKYTWKNWVMFHNRFAKENITLILNMREYRIAFYAAKRMSYAEIAQQEGISVGRLSNIMQNIYGKLMISSRKELAKFILWAPGKT